MPFQRRKLPSLEDHTVPATIHRPRKHAIAELVGDPLRERDRARLITRKPVPTHERTTG